jgi:hypothetical protein
VLFSKSRVTYSAPPRKVRASHHPEEEILPGGPKSHVATAQVDLPMALSPSIFLASQRISRGRLPGLSDLRHSLRLRLDKHAQDWTLGNKGRERISLSGSSGVKGRIHPSIALPSVHGQSGSAGRIRQMIPRLGSARRRPRTDSASRSF